MINDRKVGILVNELRKGKHLAAAVARAGMSENTARKWRKSELLPSETKTERNYKTREDPFAGIWDEAIEILDNSPGIEAKTLFVYFQRRHPGMFQDGQLRTFQRKVKVWRVTEGQQKEVFFSQIHKPGILAESDFTSMNDLDITIHGQPFDHMLYHFVLTYSNWEAASICFSENFQALSEGLQKALWELGAAPHAHKTDRLTTAIHNDLKNRGEFTRKYNALLGHYRIEGSKTQAGEPHENGDIEQAHFRLKKAIDQELIIRGSRDFDTVDDYRSFLRRILGQQNAGRSKRLAEELPILRKLPNCQLESAERVNARVRRGSTIRVKKNTYSVDSRLRDESVEARIFVDHIEVWYAQKMIESFPRLRGSGKHKIDYRHVIHSLVKKPGAFANYSYREEMFPSSTFRIAYDRLRAQKGTKADSEYLKILYCASMEGESRVEGSLQMLIEFDSEITSKQVAELVAAGIDMPSPVDVKVDNVKLSTYDTLLTGVT